MTRRKKAVGYQEIYPEKPRKKKLSKRNRRIRRIRRIVIAVVVLVALYLPAVFSHIPFIAK